MLRCVHLLSLLLMLGVLDEAQSYEETKDSGCCLRNTLDSGPVRSVQLRPQAVASRCAMSDRGS